MLTEAPTLVVCADKTAGSGADADVNYVPCLSNELPEGLSVRTSASGPEVAVVSELVLQDSWLSGVESQRSDSLTITWSREGFAKIRELLSEQSTQPILALKVDGWIEAITSDRAQDGREPKSATFRWLQGSKRPIRSLEAALRGPSIANQFELLE